jgi:hypothetical protein
LGVASINSRGPNDELVIEMDTSDRDLVSSRTIDCTIDFTRLGRPTGVEVLHLRNQIELLDVARLIAHQSTSRIARFSYDPSADAAYVKIADDGAWVQQRGSARFDLNRMGDIVRIQITPRTDG